mmetsp:Transcript_8857/g.20689  ORF Transcript_8857/g.20689 Transcript_8857/m.20689 type:complete len:209 (+) Transcript_8857:423-1049(+)
MTRLRSDASRKCMMTPSPDRCASISCTSSSNGSPGVVPMPLSAASASISPRVIAFASFALSASSTAIQVKATLHLMYSSSSTHATICRIAAATEGSSSPLTLSTGKNHSCPLPVVTSASLFGYTLALKTGVTPNSSWISRLMFSCSTIDGTLSLCVPMSTMGAPCPPPEMVVVEADTLLIQKRRYVRLSLLASGGAVEQRLRMSKKTA